jgi:MFS family permease
MLFTRFFEQDEWRLLWPFYAHRFLQGVIAVSIPFLVIYYQGRGFSFARISILWMVMAVANIVFEVPTGIVADVFGRRTSVLLGFLFESVPWFLVPFTRSYVELVLACTVIAIGQTLVSGAFEAWVYDELKSRHREGLISAFYAKYRVATSLGLLIGPLVGAWVVSRFPLDWLFFVEGLAGVLLTVPFALVTHERFVRRVFSLSVQWRAMASNTRKGFGFIAGHAQFKLMLVAGVAFAGFLSVEDLVHQPLLTGFGMPVAMLGVFVSVAAIVTGVAPFVGNWLARRWGERWLFVVMTSVAGLAAAGVWFVPDGAFLAAALLLVVTGGATFTKNPVFRAHLQHLVPSAQRATILSAFSMGQNVMNGFVLVAGGFLTDVIGPRTALVLSAALLVPALVAFWFVEDIKK